ncbi:MAG: phosphoenolpyruvate carboxykinase (ATP) [Solirubrobacterales bacterium]
MNNILECLNIDNTNIIYENLSVAELIEHSIKRNEGILSETGALVINTGKYTGRSPKDRFIVRQKSIENKVNWGDKNQPLEEQVYINLLNKTRLYLKDKPLYVFNGFVGAIKEYRHPIKVVCEKASSAHFSNQMFIRPEKWELDDFKEEFTVIAVPGVMAAGKEDGVNSEAFIIINFDEKTILIGGTAYLGEMKKAVFTVMNFLLPSKGVMPMHCSANVGPDGKTAVFFGLSGTGKTTLSADPDRKLIGDDEHGWCDAGIFNFEGGCYAKTIKLNKDKEIEIYNAIKFGTLLENVVLDENRKCNYYDDKYTENTRAAYPIDYIESIQKSGIGNNPSTVIFLTADAFGVMPAVSKLSKEGAMYHFMSGFTSKVAGTERGIEEPVATFSSCFGEPFMLMNPAIYAKLLGEKIEKNNTEVYMVNTGWLYGGYEKGDRIKLTYTRNIIDAILNGELKNEEYYDHPVLNVMIPKKCPGVPAEILDPRNTWEDKNAYDEKAQDLARKFHENFKKFIDVPQDILEAGPIVKI